MSALAGKRIVITRAPHQVSEFEHLLAEKGAVSLLYPCVDIAPPQDSAAFDSALRDAAKGAFDWLVLTSTNTVQAIANRLTTLGINLPALKVAAVGPATAAAIQHLLEMEVSVIPATYSAEGLANILQLTPGTHILLPQSALADDILTQMLRLAGANVVTVEAYQTVIGNGGVDLPRLLKSRLVDAVTFTSPSTVNNLLERFKIEGGAASSLRDVCIACIGAKTANEAREHGFSVSVMPDEHTIPALVSALEHYFDSEVRNDVQTKR